MLIANPHESKLSRCPSCNEMCCRTGDNYCRKCKHHLTSNDSHCDHCGASVICSDKYCHQCGRELNPPEGARKQ